MVHKCVRKPYTDALSEANGTADWHDQREVKRTTKQQLYVLSEARW